MGDAIDGIKGITRTVTDAAYGFATGKTKKVKLHELIAGHGSIPQVPVNNNGSAFGWGFGHTSSPTASSNY